MKDEEIIRLQAMQLISVRHELAESKQREAELQASKNVLSTWTIELEARVKTLEDALTFIRDFPSATGDIYKATEIYKVAEQTLAEKEPK